MSGQLQQPTPGSNVVDMLHERASNASPGKISRYEEVINVAGLLEISVAGDSTFNRRNERMQGGNPSFPLLLVVGGGCPGIELFFRIEAAGKCMNGRHEYTSEFRLLAWNEITNEHVCRSTPC